MRDFAWYVGKPSQVPAPSDPFGIYVVNASVLSAPFAIRHTPIHDVNAFATENVFRYSQIIR